MCKNSHYCDKFSIFTTALNFPHRTRGEQWQIDIIMCVCVLDGGGFTDERTSWQESCFNRARTFVGFSMVVGIVVAAVGFYFPENANF